MKTPIMNGIDVSAYQGIINWKTAKSGGVDFAILRAGLGKYATQIDKQFEANYNNAKAAGVHIGAYWYSYAMNAEQAVLEAKACIEVLRGKKFDMPIYYDVEEQGQFNTGKKNVSAIIRAFCEELEKAGYWVGLYTNSAAMQSYIEDDIKTRYAIWIAHWGVKEPTYKGEYGMWQYGAKGKIAGINGDVDVDYGYVDYPAKIKEKGLNGYGTDDNAPTSLNPYPAPTRPLKRHYVGTDVKWLQYELIEAGYLRKNELDGSFGNITFGALLAFQFDNGLEVDGVCGPKTVEALDFK